ncbi:MAG: serine/threonine protein kinase [Proteobacteria bacterium]|nr:serine/threonine protein kinase [Pseudomonadota bacterium]
MAALEQKYRIIDKLDSGGMAEIYRAEAELIQGMKKKVAIKRILPHLTKNEKFVAMFLDEARLSLHLDHANIVHVFDIGRAGSTYFLVMEYVEGVNLRVFGRTLRERNRPIRMAEAIFITMEICKGLAYAHEMLSPEDGRPLNIVHRDVSPPNILLSRNGEVKLVDFGLAKAASQVEQTDPGVVKGKFSYLSPEAASGIEVDHRADIFAAGIILFELLTGRRLFFGESDYQTVELVRRAYVPSLLQLDPRIPEELDVVAQRALARDREARYQSANEMHDALAQLLFQHGLKVTSQDIAKLVRRCRGDQPRQTTSQDTRTRGVINNLIRDEIAKFTSLESVGADAMGARPLSPDDLANESAALMPRDFVDPRGWTNEFGALGSVPPSSTPLASGDDALPEVFSLEQALEGTADAASQPPQPLPGPWRRVAVAVLVFAALGALTTYLLRWLGVLGHGAG